MSYIRVLHRSLIEALIGGATRSAGASFTEAPGSTWISNMSRFEHLPSRMQPCLPGGAEEARRKTKDEEK